MSRKVRNAHYLHKAHITIVPNYVRFGGNPTVNTLCTGCTYSGKFSHSLVIGRIGVNYKW